MSSQISKTGLTVFKHYASMFEKLNEITKQIKKKYLSFKNKCGYKKEKSFILKMISNLLTKLHDKEKSFQIMFFTSTTVFEVDGPPQRAWKS